MNEKNIIEEFETEFFDIWNKCVYYTDLKHSNSHRFLMLDKKIVFIIDFYNETIYCHCVKVWKHLIDKFGYSDSQISNMIRYVISERFKIYGLTPKSVIFKGYEHIENEFGNIDI